MFHSKWRIILTDMWIYAATPDPERPAKRKASSPMSAEEGNLPPYQPRRMVDYKLLVEEPTVKPVVKKRKVIISDDENLDDEPVAGISRTPKKGTKKSNKAQAKFTGKSASQASNSKKVLAVEPAEDDAGDDVVSDEEELAAASTT